MNDALSSSRRRGPKDATAARLAPPVFLDPRRRGDDRVGDANRPRLSSSRRRGPMNTTFQDRGAVTSLSNVPFLNARWRCRPTPVGAPPRLGPRLTGREDAGAG